MPYYNICDLCGATLDPGEKCTCTEEKRQAELKADVEKMVNATIKIFGNSPKKNRRHKLKPR